MGVTDCLNESVANDKADGRIFWSHIELDIGALIQFPCYGDFDKANWLMHLAAEVLEEFAWSWKNLKVALSNKVW